MIKNWLGCKHSGEAASQEKGMKAARREHVQAAIYGVFFSPILNINNLGEGSLWRTLVQIRLIRSLYMVKGML